jgi:hypothetical protein
MKAIITSFEKDKENKLHKHVCVKIPFKNVEVSIAFDNSLGAMEDLRRYNLCVYDKNGANITERILGASENTHSFSAESFVEFINKVNDFDKRADLGNALQASKKLIDKAYASPNNEEGYKDIIQAISNTRI